MKDQKCEKIVKKFKEVEDSTTFTIVGCTLGLVLAACVCVIVFIFVRKAIKEDKEESALMQN